MEESVQNVITENTVIDKDESPNLCKSTQTFNELYDLDNNESVIDYKAVQKEALNLFAMKNADYGNAFKQHGIIGILVRISDKISRAQNITTTKVQLINNESLRDTLLDLHNYSAMGVMSLDKQKPQLSSQSLELSNDKDVYVILINDKPQYFIESQNEARTKMLNLANILRQDYSLEYNTFLDIISPDSINITGIYRNYVVSHPCVLNRLRIKKK